jgi:N-acetylglucosaminyl-diphospho-decaprenol L-rhamnosyltransferase
MDDPQLAALANEEAPHASVIPMYGPLSGLPLARARNLGAEAAIADGADLLIFLDVDCVPAAELVGAYEQAASIHEDDLLCGPVAYLPPAPTDGYDLDRLDQLAQPHPARPCPPPGHTTRDAEHHELFWSLSFAVTPQSWQRVGGFHEGYTGYGAEDTDFGYTARAAGLLLAWVGGARAFHQHHPVSTPPVEHLADIVRNANVFHARWGVWPMGGWLTEFQRLGLVEWASGRLAVADRRFADAASGHD